MSNELWRLSAVDLARHIASREISCREAAASCLARLDDVNPRLNAVVEVLADEALHTAAEADAMLARGEPVGPLHGVPVTIKVNVDQAGRATTNGVAAYRSTVATADSPAVANLRKAGAIIIGRNNTPAFSMRWFTDNAPHGRTLNPYDATRTPGGSSGGAAAAVAAGIGPLAHGNDQGGSIRYPAYACGVAGLRPSFGRVPAFNPSQSRERTIGMHMTSVQGPLARSVADLRLALAAMSAADARDPWWTPAPLDAAQPANAYKPGTRVAVCTSLPGYRADPEVVAAVAQAARWLEQAGYTVEEAAPPRFTEAAELWLALTMNETKASVRQAVETDGDDAIRRAFGSMYRLAPDLDLVGYMDALALRSNLLRDWQLFLAQYPLLLMPVSWQRPFAVDADQQGDAAMREILDAQSPLLAPAMLGLPGLSVPTGMAGSTPMGVQLVAGRFQEALCLAAGEAIERCAGWSGLAEMRANRS
ncbi:MULTISPECIES: amidase family protein [Cupriavidus]|uniref:Amidase n=1 Tax=Cupriavidus oxalaticus TaxID=96344 RepID=A0A4P7LK12_9BURK|nr:MULTISPECIES: amidase family protein [Cupriavidus]MBF6989696.1 amidase family protein [Cupriavidus sp. IK-TO18]QBY55079.1 amidase [Cupriavidus oxalaticus]